MIRILRLYRLKAQHYSAKFVGVVPNFSLGPGLSQINKMFEAAYKVDFVCRTIPAFQEKVTAW